MIITKNKKEEMLEALDKFSTKVIVDPEECDKIVETYYDGQQIQSQFVTDRYSMIDFKEHTKSVLNHVENYLNPESYTLKLKEGIQELRVIGDKVNVNGDDYKKTLYILNSTDKSRAFQVNVGLFRMICSNGCVIPVKDCATSIKLKHFEYAHNEIEIFLNNVGNTVVNFDSQLETIEKMKKETIDFYKFSRNLLLNDKDELIVSNVLKHRAFVKNIFKSKTDALDVKQYDLESLKKYSNYITTNLDAVKYYDMLEQNKEANELILNKYDVFNLYVELFKEKDSGLIHRETKNVVKALELA